MKTENAVHTFTLEELVGDMPDWWHIFPDHGGDSHCGSWKRPPDDELEDFDARGTDGCCPDCLRIERQGKP